MNPFKTVPALAKLYFEAKRYNANIPALQALRDRGDIEGERELIFREEMRWIEAISKKLNITYEIIGEENMPDHGPVMVYSNHQSFCDVFAILRLFRDHFQIGFIAKDEWRKVKTLAVAIEYTRSIFLVRGSGREAIAAIKQTAAYLHDGFSLAIFPEGTRSQCHEMGEFKAGAFKFAEKAKVPILPVTLDGGYKLYEEKGSFHPCHVKIKVHPVVHIEEMDKHQQKEAAAQIEQTIRDGLKDM